MLIRTLSSFVLATLVSSLTIHAQESKNLLDDGTFLEDYSFVEDVNKHYAKTMACASSSNLVTFYAQNNAQRGTMFDIQGINGVTILCFEMNFNAGTSNVEIYTKAGTHVGFTGTPGAWTLLGTAVNVVSAGVNLPTSIPIAVNTGIAAGATQAFYITRTTAGGPTVAYTNGTAVGNVLASDANIRIREGTGKDYPFGANFTPRQFNGRVFYNVGVLPVEFKDFDAVLSNEKVELTWSTASEKNNSFYTIERSVNGIDFTELKKVSAAGNSIGTSMYHESDESPLAGISYYRIRQTDHDGRSTFTNILAVSKELELLEMTASPVPACDYLKIAYNSSNESAFHLKVYNLSGQILHDEEIQSKKGYNQTFIDVAKFEKGIYYLNIAGNGVTQKTKFLKD